MTDVEEQFDAFTRIAKQYLLPASPHEVNISSKMRTEIASRQDKETFSGLDKDSRHDVLQAPLKDVVKMLEDNLLKKFKQTPGMQQRRRKRARRQSREFHYGQFKAVDENIDSAGVSKVW